MKLFITKPGLFGLLLLVVTFAMASCKVTYLDVSGVAYQSLCSEPPVSLEEIPSNAKIVVFCLVDETGLFNVSVENKTDKIMTIDRKKCFFRDGNENSIPYYDPTIVVSTQSTTVGGATGASVNLGSLANAAGIGGALGTALGGVNVGGSSGSSTTNTETTYIIDQEMIQIAPHGRASLGKAFKITGVGQEFLSQVVQSAQQDVNNSFAPKKSYALCNLCISYSLDDGKNYETIITDIYADVLMVNKVWQKGKTNEALRKLYSNRKDLFSAQWFMLHFESNFKTNNVYKKTTTFINYK